MRKLPPARKAWRDITKATRGPSALFVITAHLIVTLLFIAFVFPPLNWPDERRNLELIANGNYGVVYDASQRFVAWAFNGFAELGPVNELSLRVVQNPEWQRIDGGLRYLTATLDAPPSYFVAKLVNILLVLFVLFLLVRRLRREPSVSSKADLYVFTLLTPAVAYQLVQVSTDVVFILFSVYLYFIDTQRGRALFAVVCALLVVEDRSFVILACIAGGMVLAGMALPWHRIQRRPMLRMLLLLGAIVLGALVGAGAAASVFSSQGFLVQFLSGVPGFGDLTNALTYTWGKSFNIWESPFILFAGLIYLPSSAEFFLKSIPLYLAAVPILLIAISIAARDTGELGKRFFYLLFSTLLTFFLITNTTHVFEHGRYYFALVPLLAVALIAFVGGQREVYPTPTQGLTTFLASLSILLTSLIALPTVM